MTAPPEPSTIWEGLSDDARSEAAYLVETAPHSPRPRALWRAMCTEWGVDPNVMRQFVRGLSTSAVER